MLVFVNMDRVIAAAIGEAPGQPLRSHADTASEAFARNHAQNSALAAELRQRLAQARQGGA